MSAEVKIRGKLTFESALDLSEELYVADEDEASRDVAAVLAQGLRTRGKTATFDIHESLTSWAAFELLDWLGDFAEAAEGGVLDVWQDSYEPDQHTRIHAGGTEEQVARPFPK